MRRPPRSEDILIDGSAGVLEALLEWPATDTVRGAAVIGHPHPLHGGTMHNKVVHTLARAFLARHFAALRFNFRGVGKSLGTFDDGRGETDDALAAARWLKSRYPGVPLWHAGFSFGAAIAVAAAARGDGAGLVSIAPAVSRIASAIERQPDCPWLVVQGDVDELVDADDTISWINGLDPGPELQLMQGTGHFFHGKLIPLRESVESFVARHQGP